MAASILSWASGLLFLALPLTTSAAASTDAKAACTVLANHYPGQIAYNDLSLNVTLDSDYTTATTRYWSVANEENVPACVFFPEHSSNVAYVVTVLNNYPSVPWAVKGGGHNANVGFSSTDGGILIAMQSMSSVTYDSSTTYATVQPGVRWGDAQVTLDSYGVAVVGGRLGDVGVAGYLLGGGLSFLSAAYGLACDSVVNYEIVTASGQLTNANLTSNKDIYLALKGGGNQFAIVTTYTLKTYPIGEVWGGTKVYSLDKKDALLNATHGLVSNYYDTKAAVIVTFSTLLLDLADIFVVFYFYNSPAGPGAILDDFMAIEALEDSTSSGQQFGALLQANSEYSLEGQRYLIRAGTIPNLPGATGVSLYQFAFDDWFATAKQNAFETVDLPVFSTAFQPLPHEIAQASAASGGNRLGFSPDAGDLMWLEYDISWTLAVNDAVMATFVTNITKGTQDYARDLYSKSKPTNYVAGDTTFTNFNPLFLNDAMYNQLPLQSYGSETYQQLAALQKEVDPNGFFSKRTGGFKF